MACFLSARRAPRDVRRRVAVRGWPEEWIPRRRPARPVLEPAERDPTEPPFSGVAQRSQSRCLGSPRTPTEQQTKASSIRIAPATRTRQTIGHCGRRMTARCRSSVFIGTGPGLYQANYPSYVTADDRAAGEVVVTVGAMAGPIDEPEPVLPSDPIARDYTMREVRVRLHQRRFRNHVLPAYRYQCTVCRLRERRLLDAAHIAADAEPEGAPLISNGLSLCSIHHRAFDQNLVGISEDYRVHISEQLLEDQDGPMLEVLKVAQGAEIVVPRRKELRPNPELLAKRFATFSAA